MMSKTACAALLLAMGTALVQGQPGGFFGGGGRRGGGGGGLFGGGPPQISVFGGQVSSRNCEAQYDDVLECAQDPAQKDAMKQAAMECVVSQCPQAARLGDFAMCAKDVMKTEVKEPLMQCAADSGVDVHPAAPMILMAMKMEAKIKKKIQKRMQSFFGGGRGGGRGNGRKNGGGGGGMKKMLMEKVKQVCPRISKRRVKRCMMPKLMQLMQNGCPQRVSRRCAQQLKQAVQANKGPICDCVDQLQQDMLNGGKQRVLGALDGCRQDSGLPANLVPAELGGMVEMKLQKKKDKMCGPGGMDADDDDDGDFEDDF